MDYKRMTSEYLEEVARIDRRLEQHGFYISAVAEKMKSIVQGEKHDENNWRRISVAGSGRKKITDGVSGGTSCLSVWCYRRGENFSDPAFSREERIFLCLCTEYDAG